jgi:hypothetical protein
LFKDISNIVETYISQQEFDSDIQDLRLLENPRFKAFIADVAVNTCDLSGRENLPEYEIKYIEQSLE